jgi:restriction system protein
MHMTRTRFPNNPDPPIPLTPEQFEDRTTRWIRRALKRDGLTDFTIEQQGVVTGRGGDYKIDALIRATILAGAEIKLLAECKHQRRPVSRDQIAALSDKLRDVGAHKGLLFSTSGFQAGATKLAGGHGISTIVVAEGKYMYLTKALDGSPGEPPPGIEFPDLIGVLFTEDGVAIFNDDDLEGLHELFGTLLQAPG